MRFRILFFGFCIFNLLVKVRLSIMPVFNVIVVLVQFLLFIVVFVSLYLGTGHLKNLDILNGRFLSRRIAAVSMFFILQPFVYLIKFSINNFFIISKFSIIHDICCFFSFILKSHRCVVCWVMHKFSFFFSNNITI